MQNTNEYIVNNQKVIVERTFDNNATNLIEVLLKYFLNQNKKENRKD